MTCTVVLDPVGQLFIILVQLPYKDTQNNAEFFIYRDQQMMIVSVSLSQLNEGVDRDIAHLVKNTDLVNRLVHWFIMRLDNVNLFCLIHYQHWLRQHTQLLDGAPFSTSRYFVMLVVTTSSPN